MNDAKQRFPLLYKPRPWQTIHVGAVGDARWKNVPRSVLSIDRLEVIEAQRQGRKARLYWKSY